MADDDGFCVFCQSERATTQDRGGLPACGGCADTVTAKGVGNLPSSTTPSPSASPTEWPFNCRCSTERVEEGGDGG